MTNSQSALQLPAGLSSVSKWYAAHPSDVPLVFEAIIASARAAVGYEGPTWQACGQLACTDLVSEVLLRDCIAPAVVAALQASHSDSKWYSALGFVDLPYTEDVLFGALLGTSDLPNLFACRSIPPAAWQVSPETLRSLNADVQRRLATFVSNSSLLGFPLGVRHQLSASLLITLDPSTEVFANVVEVFLAGLLEAGMRGLAFVVWRSLADVSSGVASQAQYVEYLEEYAEDALREGATLLDLAQRLAADELLLSVCSNRDDLCVAIGAMAVKAVRMGANGELRSTLFRVMHAYDILAPDLAESMRIWLASDDEKLRRVQRQSVVFAEFVEKLGLLLEARKTYRGLPLAQEIWRYNVVNHFSPVHKALCAGDAAERWTDSVGGLDAEGLVKDCPLQKESRHPIEGKVLADLVRDTGEVIDMLREAHGLLLQNHSLATPGGAEGDAGELGARELGRLSAAGPLAAWAVANFLQEEACDSSMVSPVAS